MPMRREDKELSKYSKYKARVDLTKIGQVASVLALLACSLGLCWGGLYSLASARVCLCWLCVRFRTARVASCHDRDTTHILSLEDNSANKSAICFNAEGRSDLSRSKFQ